MYVGVSARERILKPTEHRIIHCHPENMLKKLGFLESCSSTGYLSKRKVSEITNEGINYMFFRPKLIS